MCPVNVMMIDCARCEFLAEDEVIGIVPHFTAPKLQLIYGDYGPFEAGVQVEVPVWLALHLKQARQCRLVAPNWFTPEALDAMIEAEKASNGFGTVPEHFIALTRLLTTIGSDDISNCDAVAVRARDLASIRENKFRTSFDQFVGGVHKGEIVACAQVNNVTRFEVTHYRQFMAECLYTLDRLHAAAEPHRET